MPLLLICKLADRLPKAADADPSNWIDYERHN